MLLSMTGQGQATIERDNIVVHVELRSVNNRYLKVVSKQNDLIAGIEPELEGIIRQFVRRGTIQVSIRVAAPAQVDNYRINQVALESYMMQASQVAARLGSHVQLNPGDFIDLPGVIETQFNVDDEDNPLLAQAREAVQEAAKNLNLMRAAEGDSMGKQLEWSLVRISEESKAIEARAPMVIEDYRNRLENKVRKVLAELQVEMQPSDILQEVQIFADRADIREELVRLASHVQQFRHAMAHHESQGRKLDFLIQEFFRETNTIGSKGNDSTISKSVVEMKTIIEQMRELVQNVE